ncbi:MAG: hypothetical protein D6698_04730, partial [Gammaproteobacteria bacterium]
MAPKLALLDPIDLDNEIVEGFGRIYVAPDGTILPSVTTILGSFPKPALERWRERLGEEEANRQSKYATDIGTFMHDTLEHWIQGKQYRDPETVEERIGLQMARAMKQRGWTGIDEIHL